MFKKPFKTSGSNVVKKSVKRNLVNTLKKKYPNLSDEEWSELIPAKGAELTITKVQGSHTVIYSLDGQPFFFDADNRGELYPTVYAMWKAPRLAETIIVQPNVFTFLERGADLFLPGVLTPTGGMKWEKGAPRSVTLLQYGLPLAVGEVIVDDQYVAQNGMKGKGVRIVHHYKDKLWEMGNRSHPQNQKGWKLGQAWAGYEEHYATHGLTVGEEGESTSGPAAGEEEEGGDAGTSGGDGAQDKGKEEAVEEGGDAEGEDGAKSEVSAEEMDDRLWNAFMTCLKVRLKKSDLPVLFHEFFADYVMPCAPEDTLDVKRSSHKKLGQFLMAMAEKGLIKVEEVSPGVHQVLDLDRSHADYRAYEVDADARSRATKDQDAKGKVVERKPLVVELFGATQPVQPVFTALGHEKRKLFTKKEAAQVLWQYVKKEKLETESGTSVRLDDVLRRGLYKKNADTPPSVPKKNIVELFISKLSQFHEVNRDDFTEVRKGAVKPVQIVLEQRQGGRKHVTRISALESFAVNPDTLAKELQHMCAASTSVRPLEGKVGGMEIIIQGLVVRQAMDHLAEKYQVPRKYLQKVDKTKVKKKK